MCGGRLWMWDNCIDSLCGDQTAIPKFSHILNNRDWKWVSIDFSNVSSWKVHLHTCCLIETKRNLVEWKWQLSSLTEGAMFGAKHVKPYFGHCSGTTCQILRPFDTHHSVHILSLDQSFFHDIRHSGTYCYMGWPLKTRSPTLGRSVTHNFTSTCQKSIWFFDTTY